MGGNAAHLFFKISEGRKYPSPLQNRIYDGLILKTAVSETKLFLTRPFYISE